MLGIAVFAVLGAIVGGQLGARIAVRIPERMLIRAMGFLFVVVTELATLPCGRLTPYV